jgi:hypothetical protein
MVAGEHLTAWVERDREHAEEINERLVEAALPHDIAASVRIAEWAFEQTEQAMARPRTQDAGIASEASTRWSIDGNPRTCESVRAICSK